MGKLIKRLIKENNFIFIKICPFPTDLSPEEQHMYYALSCSEDHGQKTSNYVLHHQKVKIRKSTEFIFLPKFLVSYRKVAKFLKKMFIL
jgi:hypothetical protein